MAALSEEPHLLTSRAREDVVLTTDLAGTVTTASRSFLALTGLDVVDVVGRPLVDVLDARMPLALVALLWETASSGSTASAYVPHRSDGDGPAWVVGRLRKVEESGYRYLATPVVGGEAVPVEALYADLRGVEADQSIPSAAVAGGLFRLTEILSERGLSYDQLIATFRLDAPAPD